MDRRGGEAREDSGQAMAHRDVDAAAGFDDREDGGDFGSGLLAADADPVFATDRHKAHEVFSDVVAQLQFRVLQEACEFRPKRQRVIRAFGQDDGGECCGVVPRWSPQVAQELFCCVGCATRRGPVSSYALRQESEHPR